MSRMEELRSEIDSVDQELVALFEKRLGIAREIAETKSANGQVDFYDPNRETRILDKVAGHLKNVEMEEEVRNLYECILKISKSYQRK